MEDVLLRSLLEHEGTIARVYRGFGVHGCIKFCILLSAFSILDTSLLSGLFHTSLFVVCLIDTFLLSSLLHCSTWLKLFWTFFP